VGLPHKDYVLPVPDLSPRKDDPGRDDDPGRVMPSLAWRRRDGYGRYWDLCVVRRWAGVVAAYEASPDDVRAAWHYLDGHPVFWQFRRQPAADVLLSGSPRDHVSLLQHGYAFQRGLIEITPHKVNPAGESREDGAEPGARLEWWYEFGPVDLLPRHEAGVPVPGAWHDWLLDGAAPVYEQAVLDVALKVWTHYGNDRAIVDTARWREGDRLQGGTGEPAG